MWNNCKLSDVKVYMERLAHLPFTHITAQEGTVVFSIEQNDTRFTLMLPSGCWMMMDGDAYTHGQEVAFQVLASQDRITHVFNEVTQYVWALDSI